MSLLRQAPRFESAAAVDFVRARYGLETTARPLPSERDQNFLLETADGRRFVLKIANATESRALLDAQHAAMTHASAHTDLCPRPVPAGTGETIVAFDGYLARVLTWLPGTTLALTRLRSLRLLHDLGVRLGELDAVLRSFDHPAAHRDLYWDLARGPLTIRERLPVVDEGPLRPIVERVLHRIDIELKPRLDKLPRSVVHGDANDHNILVSQQRVSGLIDFGDMAHSWTVAEPAVAAAYAMLDEPDPLAVLATIARGYHSARPLNDDELAVLFDLVCLRLCMSVCIAADQQRQRPDDRYLAVSQAPIRRTLPRLAAIPADLATTVVRAACDAAADDRPSPPRDATLAARQRLIGRNLSLAYRQPLTIVRGWMQYLYDAGGRRYLDAYNNVPHVGHAHPRVVSAIARQSALLNTNTRYLHDHLTTLASRLTATLPEPLRVCYFVNSGSEANELALRLARAHTGRRDTIVLDAAYHGHTTTLIEISPYKFNGPGGQGQADWVHVAPLPDTFRGTWRSAHPDAGVRYAETVAGLIEAMRARGRAPAAFIAETCPSVGGQIILPDGYLQAVYRHVRDAGGVCIADEVQTAYGRMGTAFYAFEDQHVVPDIVVLGKPIGNGYPIGAVVTTEAVARSFDNGMEFFSTFGGSTVSCAAGLAVLEVVLEEGLQAHASRVGATLLDGLRALAARHPSIGDVRGSGLFIGVELVEDPVTLAPGSARADAVVNRMRDEGILLGTDGPFHNVLKIRPPMPFDAGDADALVSTLDRVLAQVG